MVIQSVVDKMVPILAAKTPESRASLQKALDIARDGTPAADAAFLKDKYPISISYTDEWRAAGDFSVLEVLPSLQGISEVLEICRLVEKKTAMKPATPESEIC